MSKTAIRTTGYPFISLLLLVMIITSCQAAPVTPSAPLPTLFPTRVPDALNLANAERVAYEFLDAWEQHDFVAMHALLSYASKEAAPFERFQQAYISAYDVMTLESLAYQARASMQTIDYRVSTFYYDITFNTRLFGSFSDSGREMQLVYDELAQAWRVAWSLSDIFAEMGQGGQLRRSTTQPRRGNIYDRNGVVLADMENPLIAVNIVKRDISDTTACYATLSQALADIPAKILQNRYDGAPREWRAEIGTLDALTFQQWQPRLEADCAATFDTRWTRRYRNGSLMPHILGGVGYVPEAEIAAVTAAGFSQDSILGRSGIERSQDGVLRGTPSGRLFIVTPGGTVLRELAASSIQSAQSVWLTIDSNLQQVVLDTLNQAYATSQAWGGVSNGASAVVIDVHTGEILALVSYPTYDLNAFNPFPAIGKAAAQDIIQKTQTDPRNPLINRVTQGRYPSGSTMKIATSMAVVQSGVFSVNQRIVCLGSWTQEGITKTDWLPSGHGAVTPTSAITQSCNPFFYESGYQMNKVDPYLLPRYLRAFGLGVDTGLVDIEADPGYIGDPETLRVKYGVQWSFVDASLMAIGQGEVEITPLQMARLTAAIAHGSHFYQPQLVLKTGILDQFHHTLQPNANLKLEVKPEVLQMVRDGMCAVTVAASGTATFVFRDSPLQDIGVCGKTGTAQNLPTPYTHAWFTAYAPREKPKIAVTVMVENAGEGSGVAAPIVKTILEYYFFGIKPAGTVAVSTTQ